MNRRTLGRGRILAGLGGLAALVGSFLPWYRVGGEANGLPAFSGAAFGVAGAGIVVFVVAVAVLALIALPIAAGDAPVAIDRPASFTVVAVVGLIALGVSVIQLWQLQALGLPDRAPGLWLAGAGMLIVAWGAARVIAERRDF